MNLKDLKQTIPYKWRVQSFSKFKPSASCVAYIDSRAVMDLLDEVVGVQNWQDDYKTIDGKLFAGIGINVNEEWIWKWDTGTESNIEKEKGQVSDAFKRAAVHFGIGRFLYSLDIKYVKANEIKSKDNYPHVVDDYGKRVWDLTTFINGEKKEEILEKIIVLETEQMQTLATTIAEGLKLCDTEKQVEEIREKHREHVEKMSKDLQGWLKLEVQSAQERIKAEGESNEN